MAQSAQILQFHRKAYEDGPAPQEDLQLSSPALAKILGLTDRRVRQLAEQGLPRTTRGLYPLQGCIRWYCLYLKALGLSRERQLRSAHLELKNQLLEHKLKVMREEVIDRVEIVTCFSDAFYRLGLEMDRLPKQLAREFNLSPMVANRMLERFDMFRSQFARSCREYQPDR